MKAIEEEERRGSHGHVVQTKPAAYSFILCDFVNFIVLLQIEKPCLIIRKQSSYLQQLVSNCS